MAEEITKLRCLKSAYSRHLKGLQMQLEKRLVDFAAVIEWKRFWDQFKSTAHKDYNISAIEKLNYLRTVLEDSALSAISGFTLSAENYGQTLDILQARYGNDQVLIAAYMQKFVQIPKIQNPNDIKRLRFLCDSVESSVCNLK